MRNRVTVLWMPLCIAAGGALGAVCRWSLLLLSSGGRADFPLMVLGINMVGSFSLGALNAWLSAREEADDWLLWGNFLGVGFLGALTTFSTFIWDSLVLLSVGQLLYFLMNILLNVVLGVLFCALGFLLAKKFLKNGA